MKSKRVILVPVGDKQAGHQGALVNPEARIPSVEIDPKTGTQKISYRNPSLNPMQLTLWEWHEKDRKSIAKLAGKDPIIYLGMGDETQGPKYTDDLETTSLAVQYLYSYWNMLPWMPMVKAVYFTQGTSVHLWGAGDTETLLTHALREQYPGVRVEMARHWLLDVNGFLADIAHHGPGPGIREWTKGNVLRLYTQSVMQRLHANHKPTPHLLLRAHRHQPVSETVTLNLDDNILKTEAWITPPFCVMGSYGQKITQSLSQMHVGMLAFEIINGRLVETHFRDTWHTFDLRVHERIVV